MKQNTDENIRASGVVALVILVELVVGVIPALWGLSQISTAKGMGGHLEATGIGYVIGVWGVGGGLALIAAALHSWLRPHRFWFAQLVWIGGYLVAPLVVWIALLVISSAQGY